MENTKLLTEAQIKAIEDLAECVKKLIEWVVDVVKKAVQVIRDVIIEMYPGKRVIHLATKHKSMKVRKKNIARIFRWFRRFVRCKKYLELGYIKGRKFFRG